MQGHACAAALNPAEHLEITQHQQNGHAVGASPVRGGLCNAAAASAAQRPAGVLSALRAHLSDGAVVQVPLVILAFLPGELLADRVGVGVRIGVGGDLGQFSLMTPALPFVFAGPGHEFRISVRIGAGGIAGRGVRFAGAHDGVMQGQLPDWPAGQPVGPRFTGLQTAPGPAGMAAPLALSAVVAALTNPAGQTMKQGSTQMGLLSNETRTGRIGLLAPQGVFLVRAAVGWRVEGTARFA